MILSLHSRILLAASVVLAGFFGLTGLVLDKAFRDSAETALQERLQAQIHALLAAAELDDQDIMRLPVNLPEPRFATTGSGLYADVTTVNGVQRWRSQSALGMRMPTTEQPKVGERLYERLTLPTGVKLSVFSFGVSWQNSKGKNQRYTFRVVENLDGYYAQVRRYRRSLWGWLGGAAILLLAVQGTILRWGLAPLRRVADDLTAIEAGRARGLSGRYPKELRGLTDNLNALLNSAQAHLNRYRDSLGNLAHSLKTPLAVLRSTIDDKSKPSQTMQEQVERMTQIVDYQLQRAATAGRTALTAPVPVRPKVERVVAALVKVYADKSVECHLSIDESVMFYGDEGDLLEILGNLADNAFKWCRRKVTIKARPGNASHDLSELLELRVEDDGPGIPEPTVEIVLQRGQRADPATAGHGLGLAMVREIVGIYKGTLSITRSDLGGAAIMLSI